MERQLNFPIIDAILCDSPFCASGGRKSKGRSMLLDILQTRTREDVAREIRCTPEFVSMVASGKRNPARWRLVERMYVKLGIPRDAWEERGSLLVESISDRELKLNELERYERARINELQRELEEHVERLTMIVDERSQFARSQCD